jgi:hypothetical protein
MSSPAHCTAQQHTASRSSCNPEAQHQVTVAAPHRPQGHMQQAPAKVLSNYIQLTQPQSLHILECLPCNCKTRSLCRASLWSTSTPVSRPFTYLGVDMTLSLNWGHQLGLTTCHLEDGQQSSCPAAQERRCLVHPLHYITFHCITLLSCSSSGT